MTISNATITGNTALDSGGGVANGGFVTVKSTILASNTAAFSPDIAGANFLTLANKTEGYNLIGQASAEQGFTHDLNNDQVGSGAVPLDPKLDPSGLKPNGGPTQTIALLCGSPAIDRGTSTSLTDALATDQRGPGFTRTYNLADVGAFELQHGCGTPLRMTRCWPESRRSRRSTSRSCAFELTRCADAMG